MLIAGMLGTFTMFTISTILTETTECRYADIVNLFNIIICQWIHANFDLVIVIVMGTVNVCKKLWENFQ